MRIPPQITRKQQESKNMMSLYDIAEKIMEKKEARTRIGWVDWSSSSWDRTESMRRAGRIVLRARGIRTDRHGNVLHESRQQRQEQGEAA